MNKSQLLNQLKLQGINSKIIKAIEKIDRKKFISPELTKQAYENYPLPIGYNQTISQPYTVAFMLQQLELTKGNKVLEIGTGSGWNAALISFLISRQGKIYTTEIIPQLAAQAKEKLKDYKNIKIFNIDASKGLPTYAPYDRIILTAAPKNMEKLEKLKTQLKDKAILLSPVGSSFNQKMIKIIKKGKTYSTQELGDFIFVPLIEK